MAVGLAMLTVPNATGLEVTRVAQWPDDRRGSALGVAIQENRAYLALGNAGVSIADLSDLSHPRRLGGIDTEGNAVHVTAANGFVYVAASEAGVKIFDASDPARPGRLGTYDTPGQCRAVNVVESLAYVADGSAGLQILDVADGAHPHRIGSYDTRGSAERVFVAGDLALVADWTAGLVILDVSNPAEPKLVGSHSTESVASDVVVDGAFAYVAAFDKGLEVFDLSNPAFPARVGGCDTPHVAVALVVGKGRAYVADGDAGLQVVDLLDPRAPRVVGGFSPGPGGSASGIAKVNDSVFLADGPLGLQTIDISTPEMPRRVSRFPTHGAPRDLAVSGQQLYLADLWGGMAIFDVADPEHPSLAGVHIADGEAYGVAISGAMALVANWSTGLERVDINNPAATQRIEQVLTPGSAVRVAVRGRYAYVADHEAGLQIIDIEDPRGFRWVGSYDTSGNAMGITVMDKFAYIADAAAGLQIISIADPENPQRVGGCATGGYPWDVAVSGSHAYMANQGSLGIIDVSDPTRPRKVASVPDIQAWGVAITNQLLFVAAAQQGLKVLDVTVPTEPRLVGHSIPGGSAFEVVVSGSYAYVADALQGLLVYRVTEPTEPGKVKWTFQTGGPVGSSPALAADGTLVVGSDDGKVYALDGQTGAKKWETTTNDRVRSSPAIGDHGLLYVGSDDGKVYALDLGTGQLRWEFATGAGVVSSPAVSAWGTVFIGSLDGRLYALDGITGVRQWAFEAGGPVGSSPAIGDDGTVFVGSDDSNLYALDAMTGALKWSFSALGSLRSSPAFGPNGLLYVGSFDGRIYAIDASTGSRLWQFQTGAQVESSPVVSADGTVYVGSSDQSVYALDAKTGVKRWAFDTGNPASASPAVGADGTVYAGSQSGTLYAFEAAREQARWKLVTGGPVVSSPTVGNGTVYFGSQDGKIYAATASAGGGLATSTWPKFRGHPRNTGAVLPYGPPRIVTQPADQSVAAGETVTFNVVATGAPILRYLWWTNGTYSGATNASLVLPAVQPGQAGGYAVVVANALGAVTSRVATLSIKSTPPGTLLFSTKAGAGVDAPVYYGGELADGRFVGQLFAGAPGKDLKPVGEALPFRSDAGKGYITAGGVVIVPDVTAGEPAQVKLVVWLRAYGATYGEARALGIGMCSESEVITITTGGDTMPPAYLQGLGAITIAPIVGTEVLPREEAPAVVWSANGNAYQRIDAPSLHWDQANHVAEGMTYNGRKGHLVAITTVDEDRFLTEHPSLGNGTSNLLDRYWIGAFGVQESAMPKATWKWVTGEPFGYANWQASITNGASTGTQHAFVSTISSDSGQLWGSDKGQPFPLARGYIIEYESVSNAPPSVLSVRTLNDRFSVTVTFSEPMDPVTASQSANYRFGDGSPVNGVHMTTSNTVVISTRMKQPGWQTLGINGVRRAGTPGTPVAPGTEVRFALTDGWVNWSLFDQTGPSGSAEDILANAWILDSAPDRAGFFTSFEFPEYEHGAELTGRLQAFLFPPVSGPYRFWLYADDSCLLYLSTNAQAFHKRLIARQDVWGAYRDYQAASEPIHLEAGRTYYLEAVYKESGGGDGVGVAWQLPGAPAPAAGDPPISGEFLSAYKTSGPPRILRSLRDPTVASGEALTLGLSLADIDGSPPYSFQWYRNSQRIIGATQVELSLPWVGPADEGAEFFLEITNIYGNTVSTAIRPRVLPDSQKPEISRVSGSVDGRTVTVSFSEVVDENSGTQIAHYELSEGLAVLGATRATNGHTVILATSRQTLGAQYALSVRGVRDLAGNEISPNTRITFPAFAEFSGLALHEVWKSTWLGTSIDTLLRLPRFTSNQPSYSQTLTNLEAPTDVMDRYGQRVSGWLVAPATGDFVFFIAADDTCRLSLSSDESAAGLRLIASHDGWTNPREWNKYASQKSALIPLTSGSTYFFEALMVEDGGGDNLAVGWVRPNSDSVEVISGAHLRLRTDPRHLYPTLVRQPAHLVRYQYAPAMLSVDVQPATYSPRRLNYQWQRNGVDVPGATASELLLQPGADPLDTGARYRCVMVDSADPTHVVLVSNEAEVTVLPQAEPSPLRIARDGNGVRVSWHPEPGLRLQSATRFQAADWIDVPGTEGLGDTTMMVSDAARFLRLWKGEQTPFQPNPDRWAWIPAGTFMMGSPPTEPSRSPSEGPMTEVTLSRGFWMGRYEVTKQEYKDVIGSHPSGTIPAYFSRNMELPVAMVSWAEATNYCGALTARERLAGRLPAGLAYRLPSEAQWEYACRAGTTTATAFGDRLGSAQANFNGQAPLGDADIGPFVMDVVKGGSYLPNAWGLYDMHGNLGEWCQDWYQDAYPGGRVTDPPSPASGRGRVVRGGHWMNDGRDCRSASRFLDTPESYGDILGFRVILVPGTPPP
ncbi:MAG: PQQ-binding-like beta-propeller repeat protein [Verrucomicrobiales bacterium]|nr:PQQ-binding-like beta-propeller repeat protein [Verrucomicrobiales bacterium]